MVGALGAAAIIGGAAMAGETRNKGSKEVKSKIVSRIQERLKQEVGEEGYNHYVKGAYSGYYFEKATGPEDEISR